jgi:hypothetical protein
MKAREKRRRRQARLVRQRARRRELGRRAAEAFAEHTLGLVYSDALFPDLLQKEPA